MARPKIRSAQTDSSGRADVRIRWTLQEAFDQFIRAKRLEQLKPRTLQDHETHYKYLLRWLEKTHSEIKYIDEFNSQVVREYIDFMLRNEEEEKKSDQREVGSSLSPVTVNVRLRTLKSFFRWLKTEGLCTEDPTANVKLLRTEMDTIKGFTSEQVALLLAQPDLNTYVGFRDYCLILFLLDTGARIQETLSTTVANIDFADHCVSFGAKTTKTRKSRIVPISQKTTNALKELIEENREQFSGTSDHLFLSIHGLPMDATTVRERLRTYGKAAGIEKQCRVSPHTFRHTFARFYIRNGGDVFTLQKILGHSSMEIVRKYVQMEQSDVNHAHAKFSPLNNLKL